MNDCLYYNEIYRYVEESEKGEATSNELVQLLKQKGLSDSQALTILETIRAGASVINCSNGIEHVKFTPPFTMEIVNQNIYRKRAPEPVGY